MNALAKLENATRMLAEVRDAKDAKHLMDLAVAAEVYARQAQLGEEAEGYARGIKIDAKTLLGQFLNRDSPPEGGRPRKPSAQHEVFKSLEIKPHVRKEARQLAIAKEIAPEVHASVRNGNTTMRELPRLITPESIEERKNREALEVVRITTKEYEHVIVMAEILDGFRNIDPDQGRYRDDPKRRLTPERMRNAGANLLRVARQWTQHEKQKGTGAVRR